MGDVYDSVFRTLVNDCRQLLFPVLNEVFGEQYGGDERIEFSPNEHFMAQKDEVGQRRITDTNFRVYGIRVKKYHFECEERKEKKILLRFFEYDSQIALDEGNLERNKLVVTFPQSVVLYLRCGKNPKVYQNEVHTPGGTVKYDVRILKIRDYPLEALFEKNLLFLLPFYIFRHENQFEKLEESEKEREKLFEEYRGILKRLDELEQKGMLGTYEKRVLTELMRDVARELTKNYENLQKGLVKLMVGEMIETEAHRVLEQGISIGEVRGIIKTYMDFNDKKDGLLDYLLKRCIGLDKEKANEYIEQYWDEQ